jgi:hypothetical protein
MQGTGFEFFHMSCLSIVVWYYCLGPDITRQAQYHQWTGGLCISFRFTPASTRDILWTLKRATQESTIPKMSPEERSLRPQFDLTRDHDEAALEETDPF